jgi:isoamyl acetate esterase
MASMFRYQNIRTICALVRKAQTAYSSAKVLLIAPPPVHQEQRLDFQRRRYGEKATGIPERTLEHTKLYASACVEVAQALNIPCLDLFSAMMEGTDNVGSFLSDGLHFNQAGQEFVGKHLLQAIDRYFPELAVAPDPVMLQPNNSGSMCVALKSSGPYHDEINPEEWETAFVVREE